MEAVVEYGAGSARIYVGGSVFRIWLYWAVHFDATVVAADDAAG